MHKKSRLTAGRDAGLVDLLQEIQRDARKLATELGASEERADRLLYKLLELVETLAELLAAYQITVPESLARAATPRQTPGEILVLKEEARRGARRLVIKPPSNGVTMVQVDDGQWFPLPARLAALLKIISSYDAGSGLGGPTPWRSLDEVARLLGAPEKPLRREYVNGLIHRLRGILWKNRVNGYYVETDRTHGVRFLLDRGPTATNCQ